MKTQLITILFVMFSILTACGFRPVYQEGSKVGEVISEIRLTDPNSDIEFNFLRHMQRKFPQVHIPTMNMDYDISFSERELSNRRNGMDGMVSYNITYINKGTLLVAGQVNSTTSYTTSSSTVGDMVNEASREDAMDRLAEMLAQAAYHQIIAKLSAINLE